MDHSDLEKISQMNADDITEVGKPCNITIKSNPTTKCTTDNLHNNINGYQNTNLPRVPIDTNSQNDFYEEMIIVKADESSCIEGQISFDIITDQCDLNDAAQDCGSTMLDKTSINITPPKVLPSIDCDDDDDKVNKESQNVLGTSKNFNEIDKYMSESNVNDNLIRDVTLTDICPNNDLLIEPPPCLKVESDDGDDSNFSSKVNNVGSISLTMLNEAEDEDELPNPDIEDDKSNVIKSIDDSNLIESHVKLENDSTSDENIIENESLSDGVSTGKVFSVSIDHLEMPSNYSGDDVDLSLVKEEPVDSDDTDVKQEPIDSEDIDDCFYDDCMEEVGIKIELPSEDCTVDSISSDGIYKAEQNSLALKDEHASINTELLPFMRPIQFKVKPNILYSREEVRAAVIISQSSLSSVINMNMFSTVGKSMPVITLNKLDNLVNNPNELVLEDANIINLFCKNHGVTYKQWKKSLKFKKKYTRKAKVGPDGATKPEDIKKPGDAKKSDDIKKPGTIKKPEGVKKSSLSKDPKIKLKKDKLKPFKINHLGLFKGSKHKLFAKIVENDTAKKTVKHDKKTVTINSSKPKSKVCEKQKILQENQIPSKIENKENKENDISKVNQNINFSNDDSMNFTGEVNEIHNYLALTDNVENSNTDSSSKAKLEKDEVPIKFTGEVNEIHNYLLGQVENTVSTNESVVDMMSIEEKLSKMDSGTNDIVEKKQDCLLNSAEDNLSDIRMKINQLSEHADILSLLGGDMKSLELVLEHLDKDSSSTLKKETSHAIEQSICNKVESKYIEDKTNKVVFGERNVVNEINQFHPSCKPCFVYIKDIAQNKKYGKYVSRQRKRLLKKKFFSIKLKDKNYKPVLSRRKFTTKSLRIQMSKANKFGQRYVFGYIDDKDSSFEMTAETEDEEDVYTEEEKAFMDKLKTDIENDDVDNKGQNRKRKLNDLQESIVKKKEKLKDDATDQKPNLKADEKKPSRKRDHHGHKLPGISQGLSSFKIPKKKVEPKIREEEERFKPWLCKKDVNYKYEGRYQNQNKYSIKNQRHSTSLIEGWDKRREIHTPPQQHRLQNIPIPIMPTMPTIPRMPDKIIQNPRDPRDPRTQALINRENASTNLQPTPEFPTAGSYPNMMYPPPFFVPSNAMQNITAGSTATIPNIIPSFMSTPPPLLNSAITTGTLPNNIPSFISTPPPPLNSLLKQTSVHHSDAISVKSQVSQIDQVCLPSSKIPSLDYANSPATSDSSLEALQKSLAEFSPVDDGNYSDNDKPSLDFKGKDPSAAIKDVLPNTLTAIGTREKTTDENDKGAIYNFMDKRQKCKLYEKLKRGYYEAKKKYYNEPGDLLRSEMKLKRFNEFEVKRKEYYLLKTHLYNMKKKEYRAQMKVAEQKKDVPDTKKQSIISSTNIDGKKDAMKYSSVYSTKKIIQKTNSNYAEKKQFKKSIVNYPVNKDTKKPLDHVNKPDANKNNRPYSPSAPIEGQKLKQIKQSDKELHNPLASALKLPNVSSLASALKQPLASALKLPNVSSANKIGEGATDLVKKLNKEELKKLIESVLINMNVPVANKSSLPVVNSNSDVVSKPTPSPSTNTTEGTASSNVNSYMDTSQTPSLVTAPNIGATSSLITNPIQLSPLVQSSTPAVTYAPSVPVPQASSESPLNHENSDSDSEVDEQEKEAALLASCGVDVDLIDSLYPKKEKKLGISELFKKMNVKKKSTTKPKTVVPAQKQNTTSISSSLDKPKTVEPQAAASTSVSQNPTYIGSVASENSSTIINTVPSATEVSLVTETENDEITIINEVIVLNEIYIPRPKSKLHLKTSSSTTKAVISSDNAPSSKSIPSSKNLQASKAKQNSKDVSASKDGSTSKMPISKDASSSKVLPTPKNIPTSKAASIKSIQTLKPSTNLSAQNVLEKTGGSKDVNPISLKKSSIKPITHAVSESVNKVNVPLIVTNSVKQKTFSSPSPKNVSENVVEFLSDSDDSDLDDIVSYSSGSISDMDDMPLPDIPTDDDDDFESS